MSKFDYLLKSTSGYSDNETISKVLQSQNEHYAMIVQRYNERLCRVGLAIVKEEEKVEGRIKLLRLMYMKTLHSSPVSGIFQLDDFHPIALGLGAFRLLC